jgi:hypothetical protein
VDLHEGQVLDLAEAETETFDVGTRAAVPRGVSRCATIYGITTKEPP